jgi:hypothetical protein
MQKIRNYGGNAMKSDSKNPLVREISICGQIAEHKSEKIRAAGGDESNILSALTAEEQELLNTLLSKLQKQWLADHAEHHGKHI